MVVRITVYNTLLHKVTAVQFVDRRFCRAIDEQKSIESTHCYGCLAYIFVCRSEEEAELRGGDTADLYADDDEYDDFTGAGMRLFRFTSFRSSSFRQDSCPFRLPIHLHLPPSQKDSVITMS